MSRETGAWMPMYWADYLADTTHLTTFQHGCYLLLIAAYWRRGSALPNDPQYLSQVCRTSCDKLARYGKPILAMFTCRDDLLYHKRIEDEILKSSNRLKSARAAGKAGGLAKSKLVTVTVTKEDDQKSAVASGDGKITKEAIELSDRIAILMGYDPKEIPPSWCGATYKIQTWQSAGWPAESIYASTQKQMAGRTGPPSTIKYFEKGIADFIAEQNSPLPKGQVNGHRGPRAFQDDSLSASRAAARLAEKARRGEFKFSPRPGLSLKPSGADVQLLPKGRNS